MDCSHGLYQRYLQNVWARQTTAHARILSSSVCAPGAKCAEMFR